jgi:hypothetical protein
MIEEVFRDPVGEPTRVIPPTAGVNEDQLAPGARIHRYTELVRDHLVLLGPCCGRKARIKRFGRRTLHLILCWTAYAAELFDEGDGGYAALLTVEEIEYVRTRR